MADLQLRVPQPFVEALRWLGTTDEYPAFANAVGSSEETPIEQLLAGLRELREADKALQALRALRELTALSRSHPAAPEDVVEALTQDPNLEFEGELRKQFHDRLLEALRWPLLILLNRAVDLTAATEHDYARARIVSDIRPVFGDDPAVRPTEAVVIHNLELSYWQDDRYNALYISLDSEDLRQLQEVVQRAVQKDHTLTSVLTQSALRRVGRETGLTGDDNT